MFPKLGPYRVPAPLVPVLMLALAALSAGAQWYGRPGYGLPDDRGPRSHGAAPAPKRLALKSLPALPGDPGWQRLEPLDRDAARRLNAAIPFGDARPLPARPFHFGGSVEDRARATECLALAAMAEAGGSDAGQRAVIQVVLNRARHPAFPNTICGVVFQGAQLPTGCQFTFTCDGSLSRRYGAAAWAAARRRAREALDGKVFAPVGSATHYHTDWVHPVWSGELAKIAAIDTHLFFRWPGYWGSRDREQITYRGGEPDALARALSGGLSGAPPAGEHSPGPRSAEGATAGYASGADRIVVAHPSGRAFLVLLDAGASAAQALALGRQICRGQDFCRVLGWTNPTKMPGGFPLSSDQPAGVSLSFVRQAGGGEYVAYDCTRFPRVAKDRCLPQSPDLAAGRTQLAK